MTMSWLFFIIASAVGQFGWALDGEGDNTESFKILVRYCNNTQEMSIKDNTVTIGQLKKIFHDTHAHLPEHLLNVKVVYNNKLSPPFGDEIILTAAMENYYSVFF